MKKNILSLLTLLVLITQITNGFAQVGLDFNGSTTSVTTNGSPVLNNQARTVDAWIKTTSTITTQQVICDWGVLSPNGSRFTLNLINNKLRIEVGGNGFTGTTSLNTGQWFHVSAVYEPSITTGPNVFTYVNGILEASGNFIGYPVLSTSSSVGFRMGVRVDGNNYFYGSMDEVKVYNYARTQAQIAADTVEYCSPQPGLVAYYKLNEGTANGTNTGSTTAIDYSGFGNHGTLNSFSLTGTTSNWVTGRVRSVAPTISVSPNTNICSGSTVSLTTNAQSNYTWSTGNSSSTLITLSPTITTTYSITTSNVLSCNAAITITVNTTPPTITVTAAQNPICTGAATSFTATGAITYTWTGGILNAQSFTPAVTTTYSLSAGNACGVVNSVHTITVDPLPVNTIASPTLVCEGYTCNLTAASSSVANFTWSPGSQTGANITVMPFSNTIYTVTASDGTCVGTQTVEVTTKTTPSITVNNTFVTICEGESIFLTASGAGVNGTYSWSPNGGTGANASVTPTATGVFTVEGTNTLGCSSSAQIPVLVIAKPTILATASNTLICSGETVTLNASGAGTYTWSTGSFSASTSVSPTLSLNVYSVVATASSNSCTATETVEIAVITPVIIYSSSVSICSGEQATLTASGANSYSWNSVSVGASGQQTYNPNVTSTYTLTANTLSLGLNCLSSHIATIMVNPTPSITIVASETLTICKGNSNTLTASGANSYSWSGVISNATQVVVTPSINTTYSVMGTSNEGCQSSTFYQVKVSNCIGINEYAETSRFTVYPNPTTTEFFISSESNLTLELFGANGQLIKTIEVNQGQTSVDIHNLSKGIYFLKGQNASLSHGQKIIIQ